MLVTVLAILDILGNPMLVTELVAYSKKDEQNHQSVVNIQKLSPDPTIFYPIF